MSTVVEKRIMDLHLQMREVQRERDELFKALLIIKQEDPRWSVFVDKVLGLGDV